MERRTSSDKFPLGSALPEFNLPGVDGKSHGSAYLKSGKAALVVFSCNHCPYVKGSEEMLIDIVRDKEKEGLRTVSINSNDAVQYPEDSLHMMKEKAKAMKLPYPYLHDETQNAAKLFDAQCTPELYLFDASHALVWHGTICDKPKEASLCTRDYLTPALNAALSGKKPDPGFVHPIGCSIKWKR